MIDSRNLFRNCVCLGTLIAILAIAPQGVSQAAFTMPDDPALSGLKLWLKADALNQADNTNVNPWTDSSGNSNNAPIATGGATTFVAPKFKTTQIDILPAVHFSRTATDLLRVANLFGNPSEVVDATILTVYRAPTKAGPRPLGFGARSYLVTPSNQHLNLATDPSLRFDGSAISTGYSQSHPNNQFLFRSTTKSGQTFAEWFNGTTALPSTTHTTDLTVVDEFYLGDLHNTQVDGGSSAVDLDIAEVIVYDRVLTTAERQGVEAYLQEKYFAPTSTRGYWRFENGTPGSPDPGTPGNVVDQTVYDGDGTAVSGTGGTRPSYSSDVFAPSVPLTGESNAVSLDFEYDNKDYVEIPHNPAISFGNQAFTLEAWVKMESHEDRVYLLHKKGITGLPDYEMEYSFQLKNASSNKIALGFGNGTTNKFINSSFEIVDNDWHYVSAAFDPDQDLVRFVLDGQVDNQDTNFGSFVPGTNDGPLIVGAHFSSVPTIDGGFDGLLDELRISSGFLALNELLIKIPEPSTITLLALGALAILLLRRRKA